MSEVVETIARAMCENSGGFAWDCAPQEMKGDCLGDARAILTALEANGYAIVPCEPSEAMIEAGHDLLTEVGCNPISTDAADAYRAMISTGKAKA